MEAAAVSFSDQGSDSVVEFCCSECDDETKEARFYCENCLKFYCEECIEPHNKLYKKHNSFARGEVNKWPLAKKYMDFLERCEVHKGKQIEFICEDHDKLCCNACVLLNHRTCSNVKMVSESVNNRPLSGIRKLSTKIQHILGQTKKMEANFRSELETLEVSYIQRVRDIRDVRQKVIAALDVLEKNTLREVDDIKSCFQESLKSNIDDCTKINSDLDMFNAILPDVGNKSKELQFIAEKKFMDKIQISEKYINDYSLKTEYSITFCANTGIEQYISKLTHLGITGHNNRKMPAHGNPNEIFTFHDKYTHIVNLQTYSNQESENISISERPTDEMNLNNDDVSNESDEDIYIAGICGFLSGQIVIAFSNQTLKLFDQQYRSIGRCEVSGSCKDMCKISPNEIAIALFNEPDSSDDDSSGDETSSSDKIHEVQLIGLDKGQLIKDRIIQLTHLCIGIASYQDDLYVTSGTALYHYKLTGSLVGKIHEDKSDNHTVWKCAVGLHGDKIFLTNTDKDCLITLAMDGSVLSRLDGIGRHADIHVTPLGQVLVFRDKKGIIQIDGDGRTIIAKDGRIFDIRVGDIRVRVQSVYYNQMTQAFILIPEEDEYMFVFEKQ
ncbi:uncharacterized protein LOC127862183 isoform X1 [Dreissena polymorpha]|uniref:B box-type domain-containing protein n=1 Tax=Dreissena polymorpha TaxID=45954 RepID=A0A9D3YGG1_DREPO|nr:uncharacterized protein LOC127862183 isoform X1 [Dreissena polymorpha]KAH3698100.1 hypothetical protein DPMN_085617 [Dreissena polymorpha]